MLSYRDISPKWSNEYDEIFKIGQTAVVGTDIVGVTQRYGASQAVDPEFGFSSPGLLKRGEGIDKGGVVGHSQMQINFEYGPVVDVGEGGSEKQFPVQIEQERPLA
ncbi:unnamed protein product [Sphagnum balticum]